MRWTTYPEIGMDAALAFRVMICHSLSVTVTLRAPLFVLSFVWEISFILL